MTVIVWFAGPLGTFGAIEPLYRLFYWGSVTILSVPFAHIARSFATREFGFLTQPILILAIAAGFSMIYSPVVMLITLVATRSGLIFMAPWWTIWGGTFLAAAGFFALHALMSDTGPVSDTPEGQDNRRHPRLLQRIDAALHGRLHSISVRDHYVDIRTEAGKASVLMRFSDAIAETEGVDGAQVHRSHWVAWDAVVGVDRQGSNLVLQMAHGEAIPVSRNHREKVEARGLL